MLPLLMVAFVISALSNFVVPVSVIPFAVRVVKLPSLLSVPPIIVPSMLPPFISTLGRTTLPVPLGSIITSPFIVSDNVIFDLPVSDCIVPQEVIPFTSNVPSIIVFPFTSNVPSIIVFPFTSNVPSIIVFPFTPNVPSIIVFPLVSSIKKIVCPASFE